MKKLIALVVMTSSALSFAADRDIYDVMYLPKAGTSFGISEGEYLQDNRTEDLKIYGFNFNQTIGHALTDRLSLSASMSYANLERNPGDDSKSDLSGISDPTFSARFRLMDETARLDLIGGGRVSLGDLEVKSNGDRNNYAGGHAVFAGLQYGMKTENFQWAVLARYQYDLERTVDVSGGDSLDLNESSGFLVRADMLNKLADKSFLRSFFSANLVDEVKGEGEVLEENQTLYTAGLEFQQLLSQDLLVRAGADYSINNSAPGFREGDSAWTFRLAANYQF